MVAFNTDYAPSKTPTRSQNRVGDFFCEAGERVGENRLASRISTKEKKSCSYELASGRPYWINRDPIEEQGGLNLYAMVGNRPINYFDYLGYQMSGANYGFPHVVYRPPNTNYPKPSDYLPSWAKKFSFSAPSIALSFGLSEFSLGGCFPTTIPGVSLCIDGTAKIAAEKCCDRSTGEEKTKITPAFTLSGYAQSFAGGVWIKTGKSVSVKPGSSDCPKNTQVSGSAGFFINGGLGPFVGGKAGCDYSFSTKKWSCYGSLGFGAKGTLKANPNPKSYLPSVGGGARATISGSFTHEN